MKRIFIYILTVLSVLFLSLGLIACGENQQAKLNLLVEEYTVNKGITRQIAYEYDGKGKITFTSSNTGVVTVSKNGEFTAVDEGSALITLKCGKQSAVCRVDVNQSDCYVDLGVSKYSMMVGSSVTFNAQAFVDGKVYDKALTWSVLGADAEKYELSANGKQATFKAKNTGYYTIEAKNDLASATCVIKVLTATAKRADTPTVSIENCEVLKWNTVNGINTYEVFIDGQGTKMVTGNTINISDFVSAQSLPYGSTLKVLVKAIAENNFDYIDSYYSLVSVSHDYAMNETVDATCFSVGTMVYVCKTCQREYTNNEYYEEHNFVKGACLVCNAYKTEGVLYFYDSNFIPMPTPAEAEDSSSEWRIKYAGYYDAEDVEKGAVALWTAVAEKQEDIPEEDRIECYYVHGLKDETLKDVYITEYYNDGVHGRLPVKYVRGGAFSSNKIITNVILPESVTEIRGSAFGSSPNLKTVVMPGVKYLPGIDSPQFNYHMGAFGNCYGLESVVVGEGFINAALSFRDRYYTGNETPKVDIYVYADTTEDVELFVNYPKFNQLLTGKTYPYHNDNGIYCEEYWHYNEKGLPVISKHNYVNNGACVNCGAAYPGNVDYGYDYNFIPMPTPSALTKNTETLVFSVTEIDSEWKEKYEKYLPESIDKSTLIKPEDWWKAVFDNRSAIPENERIKCYYVKGSRDIASERYVIPETYRGAQGILPVKYVGYDAFRNNNNIKEFIATETLTELRGASFYYSKSLETAVLPGLSYLPSLDLYMLPYKYRMANFDGCDSLTKLVVSGQFKANGNHFTYAKDTQVLDKVCLYIKADSIENVVHKMSDPYTKVNKLLTDNKYAYDDPVDGVDCGNNKKWHYNSDGIPVRNAHEYANGVCGLCGAHEMTTVKYSYDGNYFPIPNNADIVAGSDWRIKYEKYIATGTDKTTLKTPADWWKAVYANISSFADDDKQECYYVSGLVDQSLTEVHIADTYNDGVHGELPVKYIGEDAFNGNKTITKVFATETLTELRGKAFANCTNLKTVVIPGVTCLADIMVDDYWTRENFNYCSSLTKIVVGEGFKAYGINFRGNTGGKIAIYIYGSTRISSTDLWIGSQYGHNALISEAIYAHDATGLLDDTKYWHYENGEPVHNKHVDVKPTDNVDGICDSCLDVIS